MSRLIRSRVNGTAIAMTGKFHKPFGKVDVTQGIQTIGRSDTKAPNSFQVFRSFKWFFHSQVRVRLKQPEFVFVRVPRNQRLKEGDGILELLLLENAACHSESPFGVTGLKQKRVSVCDL